jgi:hypothetical protein
MGFYTDFVQKAQKTATTVGKNVVTAAQLQQKYGGLKEQLEAGKKVPLNPEQLAGVKALQKYFPSPVQKNTQELKPLGALEALQGKMRATQMANGNIQQKVQSKVITPAMTQGLALGENIAKNTVAGIKQGADVSKVVGKKVSGAGQYLEEEAAKISPYAKALIAPISKPLQFAGGTLTSAGEGNIAGTLGGAIGTVASVHPALAKVTALFNVLSETPEVRDNEVIKGVFQHWDEGLHNITSFLPKQAQDLAVLATNVWVTHGVGKKAGQFFQNAPTLAKAFTEPILTKEVVIPVSELRAVFNSMEGSTPRATKFMTEATGTQKKAFVTGQQEATVRVPRQVFEDIKQHISDFNTKAGELAKSFVQPNGEFPSGFSKNPFAKGEPVPPEGAKIPTVVPQEVAKIPTELTSAQGSPKMIPVSDISTGLLPQIEKNMNVDTAKIKQYEQIVKDGGELPPVPVTMKNGQSSAGKQQLPSTKTSGVATSIEQKAVEKNLTEGLGELAEYTPITIKEQAKQAIDLIKNDFTRARSVVLGESPLPHGLRGASLLTAMEDHAIRTGNVSLLQDLARSPLTAETSVHAQELRLLAERNPESPLAAIQKISRVREQRSLTLKNERDAAAKKMQKGQETNIRKNFKDTLKDLEKEHKKMLVTGDLVKAKQVKENIKNAQVDFAKQLKENARTKTPQELKKTVVQEIRTEIQKTRPTKESWLSFVESIKC